MQFVDQLPKDGRRGSRHELMAHRAVAESLRERPGQWALVNGDSSPSLAYAIRAARLAAFRPAGAYEAVSRRNTEDGRTEIYARYVGEDD